MWARARSARTRRARTRRPWRRFCAAVGAPGGRSTRSRRAPPAERWRCAAAARRACFRLGRELGPCPPQRMRPARRPRKRRDPAFVDRVSRRGTLAAPRPRARTGAAGWGEVVETGPASPPVPLPPPPPRPARLPRLPRPASVAAGGAAQPPAARRSARGQLSRAAGSRVGALFVASLEFPALHASRGPCGVPGLRSAPRPRLPCVALSPRARSPPDRRGSCRPTRLARRALLAPRLAERRRARSIVFATPFRPSPRHDGQPFA